MYFVYNKSVTGVDLNTLTKSGFYYGYNNMINTPANLNYICIIFIIAYSEDWLFQFFAPVDTAGDPKKIYVRTKYNATHWSSWRAINITTL